MTWNLITRFNYNTVSLQVDVYCCGDVIEMGSQTLQEIKDTFYTDEVRCSFQTKYSKITRPRDCIHKAP